MADRILVLGGTRSGKSRVAEELMTGAVVYVATGGAGDAELVERVTAHRARRPPAWRTLETADIAAALGAAPAGASILIDALGPWLAQRMSAYGLWAPEGTEVAPLGAAGRKAIDGIVAEAGAWWELAAARAGGPVVLVADESGLGVTPADPSSRRWLDLAGAVLQRLAADADCTLLVVAGRALPLASPPPPPAPPPLPEGVRTWSGYATPSAHTRAVDDLAAHGDRMVAPGAMDFAVNVHGERPPAHLREVLLRALDDVGRYPDDSAARTAAAARHRRSVADVLVTAGAAEAFRLLAGAVHTASRPSCTWPSPSPRLGCEPPASG